MCSKHNIGLELSPCEVVVFVLLSFCACVFETKEVRVCALILCLLQCARLDVCSKGWVLYLFNSGCL